MGGQAKKKHPERLWRDEAGFGDNPFAALDQKNFPRKGEKGVSRAPGGRVPVPEGSKPRKARTAEVDDEARLFLSAMSQASVMPEKKTASGGFGLDEQGGLSQKIAARKKASAAAAKPPAKDPVPAARPVPAAASGSMMSPAEQQVPAEDTDDAAFLLAMRQVSPLQGKGRDVVPPVVPQTAPPSADTSLQDFLDGKLEFALSFTDEYLEGYVVGLDPLIMGKLRAGSLSPEAHMDLHGLNVQQAFESLRGFLRGSWYKGLRTVLLVPGRGRNSPDGVSVLRGKLQTWLTQDPFKRVVLAFCTAQPHDGGPGSIYVLLRKFRKKGRICWERMPADADLF